MDHISIGDQEIQEISRKGIRFSCGFIDFAECAARYLQQKGGDGQCVGESGREGKKCYLTFYTRDLITRIVFLSENALKAWISKKAPADKRLQDLKDRLTEFGYTVLEEA